MVERFGIYWVDFNPTKGSEINKIRPAVVVSPPFEYGYNYSLDIDTHSLSLAGEVYFRRKRGYDSHRPDSDCR